MRAALTVLAILTAAGVFLLFAAPLSSGDKDEIRDVIARYINVADDRDGEAVCETLTQTMRDRYDNCEKEALRFGMSGGRTLTVTDISGSGDAAEAVVNLGKADGQRDYTAYGVSLQQVDGEWLIDEDSTCLGPPTDLC